MYVPCFTEHIIENNSTLQDKKKKIWWCMENAETLYTQKNTFFVFAVKISV